MPEAYIVEAVRTAGGRRGGRLAGVHPVDLAATSLDAIMERSGLEAKAVDDVVKRFFDNSPMKLVNYFAKEQKLDAAELERLVKLIKDQQP